MNVKKVVVTQIHFHKFRALQQVQIFVLRLFGIEIRWRTRLQMQI